MSVKFIFFSIFINCLFVLNKGAEYECKNVAEQSVFYDEDCSDSTTNVSLGCNGKKIVNLNS